MKILYVSTRSDTIGGSNIHIRDLSVLLQRLGHQILVAGGQDGIFADDLRSHGIEYLPLKHLVRNIRPHNDIAAIPELRKVIRRFKPDIVSLHTAKAGVVGRLAALNLNVPVIYTPHGWTFTTGVPPAEAFIYLVVERLISRTRDRIINVCETDRTLALRRRVGSVEQHLTIHNGMPDIPPDLLARPDAAPARLVMVARFEKPKDHEALLQALAQCSDIPWTLGLIGDGPAKNDIQLLVDSLGLSDRVDFLGHRADIPELLATYQLFLLISRWEGFPRSIIEAMRAGLPVIASDVGGIKEAVINEVTGTLIPAQRQDELVTALRRLISDSALRARMGKAGRARYEELFTFERMAEQTLREYVRLHESAGKGMSSATDVFA